MPAESKSLSEFPRALEVLSGALLLISNPSGQDSFDTNSALLTEVAQAMLNVHYTQELGDVSVFDAIKNTRVLSGTTTPTANEGANGQLYVKYETVSNVDNVVGMYFKKDGAWLEISLGGGGNTDYIECTQAQYDAWEQGGTLDPDTLYFIIDGNIGNDIIDDSTTSATTVWSSDKTGTEIEKLIPDITTIATISDTVVNSTDKDIYTVSLNKGVYIFNGSTLWKTSGTAQGLTMIALLGNDTLTQNLEYTVGWCVENLTAIFKVSNDNTTFKVRLYQTTGANIAVDFNGNITRIMNY